MYRPYYDPKSNTKKSRSRNDQQQDGARYLAGDAAEENIQVKASIESAKGLAAVLATDTELEEITVGEQSKIANVILKDSGIGQGYSLIIIAIKKANNDTILTPSFESRIHPPGDTLIAAGKKHNLITVKRAQPGDIVPLRSRCLSGLLNFVNGPFVRDNDVHMLIV